MVKVFSLGKGLWEGGALGGGVEGVVAGDLGVTCGDCAGGAMAVLPAAGLLGGTWLGSGPMGVGCL